MKKFLPVFFSIMFAFAVMHTTELHSARNASPCRGLTKAACEAKAGCCWTKRYQREGKTVHGFCHKCGAKKAAAHQRKHRRRAQ
ncbi:MAG TPA: hypothetical protein PK200_13445 [Spirochaetota bacterium]|nr:hypothetical protein [Spirochaetota bacterium]HQO03863.1 hypothetical protein [Spirochaetota bacterium]HQP47252.1 hypothetical protein [Spirochaetota bacterium]